MFICKIVRQVHLYLFPTSYSILLTIIIVDILYYIAKFRTNIYLHETRKIHYLFANHVCISHIPMYLSIVKFLLIE